MRVVIVHSISIEEFFLSALQTLQKPDLLIFSFGVTGDVDFETELKSDNGIFSELVLLSDNLQCVVIAAMDTSVYGHKYKSVAVIDKGKLIDISDMVHKIDPRYRGGRGFRVYDTSVGKLGIIVHTDILFPETARILALCDSEILVSLIDKDCPYDSMLMARAASLANGLINICASDNKAYICNHLGAVIENSAESVLETDIVAQKNSKLLEVRRKDKYREIFTNFY